mgnify:CR=1 FL=1
MIYDNTWTILNNEIINILFLQRNKYAKIKDS